jgi:hypothetical protein
MLASGLLLPGAVSAPVNDDELAMPALVATPLAEAQPPYAPDDPGCGHARPELRFGWIDTTDESPPHRQSAATACLAVYQLPEGARPLESWQ